MSFQDIFDDGLEAGLRPPPPPPLHTVVSHSVFQINTGVARLWHLADALACCRGAGDDARATRERIRRTRAEVMRLARNTARKLANDHHHAAAAVVGPRLAADFEAALREFQRVQQRIIAADRGETAAASAAFLRSFFCPPASPGNGHDGDRHQRSIQMPRQLIESRRTRELAHLDTEAAFSEALVQEREREISKIQQEIAEINEIVRDLAKRVHGQREAIEIVTCHPGAADVETAPADGQLGKVATTQDKTRSETVCMLMTASGLLMTALGLMICSLALGNV